MKIEQIATEIVRLAAENPDRSAECRYLDGNEQPVCIVGTAVYNLVPRQVALDVLHTSEGAAAGTVLRHLNLDDGHWGLSREVGLWIRHVQYIQDRGYTWGVAKANADTEYPIAARHIAEQIKENA